MFLILREFGFMNNRVKNNFPNKLILGFHSLASAILWLFEIPVPENNKQEKSQSSIR